MESEILRARVFDTLELAQKSGAPKFFGFLTAEESATADCLLKSTNTAYSFFGGYDGAERTVLCCTDSLDYTPVFPIESFTLKYRPCDRLSHRDFLGALMSLGITRASVGDILIEDGRAVIFIYKDVARYVKEQLKTVGRVGVTVSEGFIEPLPQISEKLSLSKTVASNRLDCIVSALIGCSRNNALTLIADGDVSVNSVGSKKPVKPILSGDRITIRHKGRFEIISLDDRSKKDRLILKYNKFI